MKLTPEMTRKIFALAEKHNVSFVDMARLILELGLKQMEEENESDAEMQLSI